jgi:hypothetical protein
MSEPGSDRITGIIRLSGLEYNSRVPYMYFGFNLDFRPVCLVSTREPWTVAGGSKNPKPSWKESELPSLGWLLAAAGTSEFGHQDETILAVTFQSGNKSFRCAQLGIEIDFDFRDAPRLDGYDPHVAWKIWSVTLEKLTPARDEVARAQVLYTYDSDDAGSERELAAKGLFRTFP